MTGYEVEALQVIAGGRVYPNIMFNAIMDIPKVLGSENPDFEIRQAVRDFLMDRIIDPSVKENADWYLQYFDMSTTPIHDNEGNMLNTEFIETRTPKNEHASDIGSIVEKYADMLMEYVSKADGVMNGARFRVAGNMNADGLSIQTFKRKYFDSDITHTFVLNLPHMSVKDKSSVIQEQISSALERDVILKNLSDSKHPELYKFLKLEGKEYVADRSRIDFLGFSEMVTKDFMPRLLTMPGIDEGGVVWIKTNLNPAKTEVSSINIKHLMLNPETKIVIRDYLPDTEGLDDEERLDAYDAFARKAALNALGHQMSDSNHPFFERYMRRVTQRKGNEERVMFTFTEEGETKLERQYDKLTSIILESIMSMNETGPAPFYLKIKPECEAKTKSEQGFSVESAKKLYLDSSNPYLRNFRIDIAPVPEGRMTAEYIRSLTKGIVDSVAENIVARHMKNDNHPDFGRYFIEDDKRLGHLVMTEEGVMNLGGLVEDLSKKVCLAALHKRNFLSEECRGADTYHLLGHRLRFSYALGDDDSFTSLIPECEIFSPEIKQIVTEVPRFSGAIDKQIAINPQKSRSDMKNVIYYRWSRRKIILRAMYDNMRSSNHPAANEFFVDEPKLGVELTDKGEVVFGKMVAKYSGQMQEEFLARCNDEEGGKFLVELTIDTKDFDRMSLIRLK